MLLFLFSCKEKKVEFIKSKTLAYIILIKNVPESDSILKSEINRYIIENLPDKEKQPTLLFYEYTTNSSYFINNKPDPGGFSSYDFHSEEEIAEFSISKCKNDEMKFVGELRFHNKYGNFYKPDTIIYKCT